MNNATDILVIDRYCRRYIFQGYNELLSLRTAAFCGAWSLRVYQGLLTPKRITVEIQQAPSRHQKRQIDVEEQPEEDTVELSPRTIRLYRRRSVTLPGPYISATKQPVCAGGGGEKRNDGTACR